MRAAVPGHPTPSRGWQWRNLLYTQCAWFAVVLSAAHGQPAWGGLAALAVVAWHLCVAPGPRSEAALIALVTLAGTAADTVVLQQGAITYASGQWSAAVPPWWMSALWAVFATSLNVTLRWMQGRLFVTVLIGAVAGPLAFASGARLGAAQLLDPTLALTLLALEWAIMLPLLCVCARRLDGVGLRAATEAPAER